MGSGTSVFCCDVVCTVSSNVEVARAFVCVMMPVEEVNVCNWSVVDMVIETLIEFDFLVDNRVGKGELVKNDVDIIDDFDVESKLIEEYDSVAVINVVGVG